MFEILIPDILHSVFSGLNILLHAVGLYLLVTFYQMARSHKTVHHLLLINLSITVIVKNVLSLGACLTSYLHLTSHNEVAGVICHYCRLAECTSGLYQYYLGIGLITLDRLLIVLLKTRYSTVCSNKRTLRLIVLSWILNTLIFILVVIGNMTATNHRLFLDWIDLYIPSIFDITFFVLTLTSYSVMFYRFASSQQNMSLMSNQSPPHESLVKIFRKSKFYLSVLLVTSSLILTTIPGMILSGFRVLHADIPMVFVYYVIGSMGMNYLVDGFIYIFMQDKVREHLMVTCCHVTNKRRLYEIKVQKKSSNELEMNGVVLTRCRTSTNDSNLTNSTRYL